MTRTSFFGPVATYGHDRFPVELSAIIAAGSLRAVNARFRVVRVSCGVRLFVRARTHIARHGPLPAAARVYVVGGCGGYVCVCVCARAQGSARSRAVARARLNYETPVVSLATSRNPIRGHGQVGSLTGAVHLSKNNAGVLRPAQRGRKPRVEQKGKSWLDPGRSVRVGTAKASASRSSRKR